MLRNISLLQHGASDLSMPLVLDEHDSASNSSTPIANLENSNAAAAINLENSKKRTSMRLLVAIHNASTVAAETSTGDFGLAETIVNAPSRCTAACIAPPLPRRAICDERHECNAATATNAGSTARTRDLGAGWRGWDPGG